MAVTQPFVPNLAGAYGNIQDALKTGAEIQSKNYGVGPAIAKGVDTVGDLAQQMFKQKLQQRQSLFEAGLQDHLNKNKSTYAAQAEGKTLTTPDDAANFATQMGLDPDKAKSLVPDEGVWQTPEQKMDIATTLKRQDQIEQMAQKFEAGGDKTKANLIRLAGRSKDPQADQMIMRINGMGAVEVRQNPADKTMHVYDKMSGADLGPAQGLNTSDGNSGVHQFNDIPSLRKVDGTQADALIEASKQVKSDPVIKSAANTLDELTQVRGLIKANIPGTQINIGADTAKAIGGVPGGRFSSMLALAEGKDPSWLSKLGQGYQTAKTGNLTENNQNKLLSEVDLTSAQKRLELAQALDEKHKTIKTQAPYASDDLIASQLGYQRYLQSEKSDTSNTKNTVKRMIQNGKKYDVTYGSDGKYVSSQEVP